MAIVGVRQEKRLRPMPFIRQSADDESSTDESSDEDNDGETVALEYFDYADMTMNQRMTNGELLTCQEFSKAPQGFLRVYFHPRDTFSSTELPNNWLMDGGGILKENPLSTQALRKQKAGAKADANANKSNAKAEAKSKAESKKTDAGPAFPNMTASTDELQPKAKNKQIAGPTASADDVAPKPMTKTRSCNYGYRDGACRRSRNEADEQTRRSYV